MPEAVPDYGDAPMSYANADTAQTGTVYCEPYVGPVAGLKWEYVCQGTADMFFILPLAETAIRCPVSATPWQSTGPDLPAGGLEPPRRLGCGF